jgi:hypothetical protein
MVFGVGKSRIMRGIGALVIGVTMAVITSSCTSVDGDHPRQTPTIVNTDSARLAAAVDAFTVFNSVLDGYAGGTKTVEDLEPLVTPEYFDVLKAEDATRDTSTRTVGASSFDDEKLVDPDDWGGYGDLSLVVCRDISQTHVVDSSGAPSTVEPLRTRIPMIIYLVSEPAPDRGLLITKVDQWNEDGYCA